MVVLAIDEGYANRQMRQFARRHQTAKATAYHQNPFRWLVLHNPSAYKIELEAGGFEKLSSRFPVESRHPAGAKSCRHSKMAKIAGAPLADRRFAHELTAISGCSFGLVLVAF